MDYFEECTTVGGKQLKCTIGDLEPNLYYEFRVLALTEFGTSKPSEKSDKIKTLSGKDAITERIFCYSFNNGLVDKVRVMLDRINKKYSLYFIFNIYFYIAFK